MISFCANELARKEDKTASFEIDEPVVLFEDIIAAGNTKGKVRFQLRNNFIIITGEIEVPVKVACDRCGKDYNIDLEFDIDEVLEVNDDPYPDGEVEFNAEDVQEQVRSDEQIDIEDYIKQYIVINVPTKKLCSETCVNEKLNDFNSKSEGIDPRWEKLIEYKNKIKGE